MRVWGTASFVFSVLLFFGRIALAEDEPLVPGPLLRTCSVVSVADSILGVRDSACVDGGSFHAGDCIEGDELSLQRALRKVHSKGDEYVAVLFYASWCPYSKAFRPCFSALALMYPSVPHFAIEESSITPSTLSQYGVHAFPSLYLLNSTKRIRYRSSRSLNSLQAFYADATGISSNHLLHQNSADNICEETGYKVYQERSPATLLQQDKYLAFATSLVMLRLLHVFLPWVLRFCRFIWRRFVQNLRLGRWWEHPLACVRPVLLLFKSLKDPWKRSNLQEGALRARRWASKSLASAVSIGNGNASSRGA